MLRRLLALSFVLASVVTVRGADTPPFADFFIPPQGNDRWSGKLAAPNVDGTDGPFATLGRAGLAVRGVEPNGIVGDPLFVDVTRGDFRLRPGSAAEKIGFHEIDVRQCGLTPEFPARFARFVREDLGADYVAFLRLADPAKP
mgnify:CR=1 FL=1